MVGDDKQRTARRYALAPLDGEPARRVVDDPGRAVTHSGLAESAVVGDESAGDMIRNGPDDPAHDLHAKACRATNKRLSALARDDLCDLTTLRDDRERERLRACNAFDDGPRISRPVVSGSARVFRCQRELECIAIG